MYSVVLMMAMTSPADDVAFGRRGGCDGGTAYAGCTGSDRGGFLGLRDKFGGRGASCDGSGFSGCNGGNWGGCTGYAANGCDGGRGGFLGLRNKFGGRGGNGCSGYAANCGCSGNVAPACCTPAVVTSTGCCGTTGAPIVPVPAAGAPGAGAGVAPPVKMPEPPAKKPE